MLQLPLKYEKLVGEFSKTLELPKKKSPHPIVVGPFGPCWSGKTTIMELLAKRLPFVHIEHDRIRLFMKKKGLGESEWNKILYKNCLIVYIAKRFLLKNYSVITDRDFATKNRNILKAVDEETKKMGLKFFLIRIKAPKAFILKRKKFVKGEKGGMAPNRETAVNCHLYSLKHYHYDNLMPRAIAAIDTSKAIMPQLKKSISFLKKEMGV